MKKMYIRRLLSLLMVLLVVFPVLVSASSPSSIVKNVYFEDEAGNMVFVDYETAINQSLEGDHTLYNGIKHYVGIAEVKGKSIYLETNTKKILDFRLAMIDNLFRLEDIIGKTRYEVNQEIIWTHELKVVDGKAVIVERAEEKDSTYRININGPETLKLGETGNYDIRAYGDGKGNVNYRARYEYTIIGGTGKLEYRDGNNWREIPLSGYFGPSDGFTLTPDWDITTELRFTPAEEGRYSIELSLEDLDKNKVLADAEYDLIVTKLEEPLELVSITPVDGIEVEVGTSEVTAKGLLPQTTTIIDSKNRSHTVNLNWTIENYNGDIEGDYTAIGRFELPEGIQNTANLELKVEAIVKVKAPVVQPEFPIEVEEVFVGKSQITNKTYANIEIKQEYISVVEAVYLDDILAHNIEDKPSQWRIEVPEGTIAEDLKERLRVEVEESVDPQPEPQIIATYHPNFIPTFGKVSVQVQNIAGAAKFDVVYHLSDDKDGAVNITQTSIVNLNEQAGLIFYNTAQYDTVTIRIYDANEVLLHIFTDIVLVR